MQYGVSHDAQTTGAESACRSVVGSVDFMQRAVAGNIGDITADYSSMLPLTDDAQALVAEINLVLTANQVSAATVAAFAGAVQTMPGARTTRTGAGASTRRW